MVDMALAMPSCQAMADMGNFKMTTCLLFPAMTEFFAILAILLFSCCGFKERMSNLCEIH